MHTKFFSDRLDGFPFAQRELDAVVAWAKAQWAVRLNITSDDTRVRGVIEIYPWGSVWPRWCVWQSPDGRLQLDDLAMNEFALPYPTIDMALRFITSKL